MDFATCSYKGVAKTKELLPSLGCLSVCKTGATMQHYSVFDILRLSDERDQAVSSWVFLLFMGN